MRPATVHRALLVGIGLWFLLIMAALAGDAGGAFWVWGRRQPLSTGEIEELKRQDVRTLYWQVAQVHADGRRDTRIAPRGLIGEWAGGIRIVPVIRVEPPQWPSEKLLTELRSEVAALGGEAMQLDFDCPDRRLGEYALALHAARGVWREVEITALAHWPRVKDFDAVARSVREICPMFYDLQRDPTGVTVEAPPPPILDVAQVGALLREWESCPTPWRVGLPLFTRVTVYDRTGLSRGQIFGWAWEDLVFHPQLRAIGEPSAGVQLFAVAGKAELSGRRLEPGESVAVRQTERSALDAMRRIAGASRARGIVYFRLPSMTDSSTASLRSLRDDGAVPPVLVLRRDGDVLLLENRGPSDLPPRLSGPRHDRDRGHGLEVDAPAPVFREAEPGGFFRVGAHTSPDREPQRSPVGTATRITFWFSHLRAGSTMRSGLFQLAPAADLKRLRWRINNGDWQPFPTP